MHGNIFMGRTRDGASVHVGRFGGGRFGEAVAATPEAIEARENTNNKNKLDAARQARKDPFMFELFQRVVHRKTQGVYVITSRPSVNVLEATREPAYSYLMSDGRNCHRCQKEMEDGRFFAAPDLPVEKWYGSPNPLKAIAPEPSTQEQFEFCIEQRYFPVGFAFAADELQAVLIRKFGMNATAADQNWAMNAMLVSRSPVYASIAAMAGYPVASWRRQAGKKPSLSEIMEELLGKRSHNHT